MTISVDILNVKIKDNGSIPTFIAMVYNNPEKAASMATGVMAKLANTPKIKTAISGFLFFDRNFTQRLIFFDEIFF